MLLRTLLFCCLFSSGFLLSQSQKPLADSLQAAINQASGLMERGEFAKGAAIAWDCIPKAQEASLFSIAGKAYHLLAGAAFNTQDQDKAMSHARNAFKAYQKADNNRGMGSAYQIVGIMMLASQQLDSAFHYAKESASYYEAAGDMEGVALAYTRMGHVYNLKEEYEKATPYYLRSYEISRSDSMSSGFMNANLSLAGNYSYRGQYDAALRHALKSYEIAQKLNAFYEKNTSLEYLSHIYEQKGNYKQALEYGRLFKATQDSVLNEERLRQVKELDVKYETAEKQAAIQLLEKDKANQQLLALGQRFFLFVLTAGILLVARSYRQRNKAQALARQLTEQQLLVEQREAERLGELDMFKSRFFTNISHEFRTPLTVILGMADQLRHRFGGESVNMQNDIVQASTLIQRNGEHLLRLINQILDLAKLESNTLKMNYVQGDITTYLPYLTESLRSLADEKGVAFRVEVPEMHLVMDYDPERLRQVVHNLISNGVKFTRSGGEVVLRVTETQPALTFTVSDTGIGIAPEDLPKVFDRFYQASNATPLGISGSGVGLSLTRELIRTMGGDIHVTSEMGKGTVFVITLPILREAEAHWEKAAAPQNTVSTIISQPDATSSSAENAADFPSLLIIEDNPDVAAYLHLCLQDKYQVTLAADGQEGIEKALAMVPDLILSDVMMPEKDGLEVCDFLKNDERTSHIPIVLLTAKADLESRLAGLRRGADAYLSKPFYRDEIALVLANLLALRHRWQQRFAFPAATEDVVSLPELEPAVFALEDAFLKKIREQMEQHWGDTRFDGPSLAKAMLLSEVQLYRKIKALTGKSTAIYIRSLRLQKAHEMLRTTQLTISEIAYGVGFEDPNYFSRTFAQEFGSPPSEIRK